ncbi:7837_t:CDS:2 [Gigaspora rosea]|nr:7837_t:CDS:2 [Gigaspora rosea]
MDSKSEAKDLPCFFAIFAQEHKNSGLLKYIEKCREGKWRNASAAAATKRITEMAKYFSELTPYLDSMGNYSLCEGHYNRVVAKKNFINQLEKGTDSILPSLDEPEKKKLKFSNDDDDPQVLEKTFVDVGIQVDLCEKTFVDLCEKTFVDFGIQVDLCEKTYVDFKQLLSENETLKKRLSERFTNQEDRILSVIEIAKKERGMKDEIHEELTNYLSIVLDELLLEKNQETNAIDYLVDSQSQTGCIKKCSFCQASDIDNKKRVCPKCHNKLPTINEMNQQINESSSSLSNIKNTTNKSLVIYSHSHRFKESNIQGSVPEPRTRPSFSAESSRFRARIRKTQFVNPSADNRGFQNISGEWTLSEEMKRFSEIAHTKRIELIKAKLINKTALDIWHPIPITCEEADLQKTESSLKKSEILSIINSLIPSLGDSDRSRFRCLSSKSRNELINILREIRSVLNENIINISNEE